VEKDAQNGESYEDLTLAFDDESCRTATFSSWSRHGLLTPASEMLSTSLLSEEPHKRHRFLTTDCTSPWK